MTRPAAAPMMRRVEQSLEVSLARCASYAPDALQAGLEQVLAPLGGLERFVRSGQSVLIKPNLLTDRPPEQAVTTHPVVVQAIIRLVKASGGIPSVGDSPASTVKLAEVWEKTGMRGLCEAEAVPLLNLEKAGSRAFTVDGCTFNIAQPILDADVVINAPKVKTHSLTVLTAGVKNLYGAVPGYQKTNLHVLCPKPADFGHMLVGVLDTVKPALTIADGVTAMEGPGPAAGRPYPLGLLAASCDAAALDVVLCRVLGINPLAVPYLREIIERRSRAGSFDGVEVRGVQIAEIQARRFEAPGNLPARLIPRPLARLAAPLIWIRPAISDACVRCGRCVKACPTEALSMRVGQRPVLKPQRCIGCCCCHEVCPVNAISMARSPLLRALSRGGVV